MTEVVMDDDLDATPFKGRRPKHVPPSERVLWTLRKDARIAEARVRQHPLGPELIFYVDDTLLWSEVFKPDRGHLLGELAERKRREFQERGWR